MAVAQLVVAASEILTYDNYVQAMTAARATLHATGACLGERLRTHMGPPSGSVAIDHVSLESCRSGSA